LTAVRNACVQLVNTEWIIHLDADDELTPDYVDRMGEGSGDVRVPAVSWIMTGHKIRARIVDRVFAPKVPNVWGHTHQYCERECLREGNYVPIGAMARVEFLRQAGGWRQWPIYEDFDLWQRVAFKTPAKFETIPKAVYRAHVRADSRNRSRRKGDFDAPTVTKQIIAANLG
jgi:hypothetical protein